MLRLEYLVTMDDSAVHKVVADGRDWAKMEVQEFNADAILTRARFLAWSSMTRHRLVSCSFTEFNETLCVDVSSIDDEPPTDEQEAADREDDIVNPPPGRAKKNASSESRSRGHEG